MNTTYDTTTDFGLLHATLYHSSPARNVLTTQEHAEAFSLLDGYGRMGVDRLRELGLLWDWSHVRDSSDEAVERAAGYVRWALGEARLARVEALTLPPLEVRRVRFVWSESDAVDDGTEVESLDEANAVLRRIRDDKRAESDRRGVAYGRNGYAKTGIEFVFYDPVADEELTWKARYDVEADGTDSDVMQHFRLLAAHYARHRETLRRARMDDLYRRAAVIAERGLV